MVRVVVLAVVVVVIVVVVVKVVRVVIVVVVVEFEAIYFTLFVIPAFVPYLHHFQ